VKALSPGETLEVTADDPAFEPDVRAWCEKTKHPLMSLTRQGGDVTALIRES
jgi:TusA-related sulfurtransferase